jgi:MarR family transcriptional regulator, organic hydroperoxide resistance regulator
MSEARDHLTGGADVSPEKETCGSGGHATSEAHDRLIGEAMTRMHGLMAYRRRAFCSQQVYREISLPQLHVLIELQESGPLPVSELAHLLGISPPSASSIVDRMEEHDLVRRVRDSEDRRVVHVEASERGRDLVSELMGMRREQMQQMVNMMTEDELQDVIRGLDAISRMFARVEAQEKAQTA